MDLNLKLNQSQQLNLTTELIQAIGIMELNLVELEDFLMRESEENIYVDYKPKSEDDRVVKFLKENRKDREDFYEAPVDEENSYEKYVSSEVLLVDILMEQLNTLKLTESERIIGTFLVENIDDDGYLKLNLNEAADMLNVDVHDVFYILKKIWTFEPRGIGARNLKECLILQTEENGKVLRAIIENHLEDISKNRINKIAKSLNISIEDTLYYIEEVKKLNPKPGSGYVTSSEPTPYIRPEIFVNIVDGELVVEIEESSSSNVTINKYYLNMLETDIDEDTRNYLNTKLSRTMFLLKSIEQRRENISKVSNELVNRQKDFFLKDSSLKPMTLKDIADTLGISESTVSRVTKNKYLQCKKGVFPLKYFFSTSIGTKDGKVSRDYIEKIIIDIIDEEDKSKPLSDQSITDIVNKKGININRRTVAKYRSELNIASASFRRRFDGI
ncbi:RNA polymerase, sigma 54 subunit, RpoN/SigL [Anaerosphaera aminiphila DSM 21120]|uniref:RNA polymerase, sigma 54 subunit, RpoN/SigL n=1 Tax=Anaerosphaera aminiphila DSM 21120 TaxID=1120995 RepID=A0A1M5SS82_9FIRM|nr:RNA polymerase factor sigma-54 [Anaerosphaera aminiphila]SHH41320.1 RNA polymerase, sigma 54 subunit, RpoN/SigL [Anaerosphaera aminiphila DSM 21120]